MLSIFSRFLLRLLSLRYSIEITGSSTLRPRGVLVLPNHVALVDPLIVSSILYNHGTPVAPLVSETYFNLPLFRTIFRRVGAVDMPDFDRGSRDTTASSTAIQILRDRLAEGNNFLVYPAGRIYRQGRESIVGKKTAYELVRTLSGDTRIILMRTRWLWGSVWSMAYTGESPALGSVLLRSIWWIFSHAFFFLPRRKVQIEIVDMTDELIRAAILGLDHFNTTLEDFYNAPGLEAVQYIRHSLIGDDVGSKTLPDRIVGSLEDIATGGGTLSETLDPLVVEEIIGYLISIFPGMLFTADTHLLLDTHLDSLQMAELKEYISATFPIASNPPISELRRVSDLVRMAMGILHATTSFKEAHWQEISGDIPLRLLGHSGDSIARRIIAHLQTERSHDMLYDPEHGVLTRKDIALKVQVLRSVLASLPGERVALLLPSLTATTVLLAATYLAGKTPVMLNWTVGEVNFRHCFEISGATKIVTSRAFLRKANIRFIEWYAEQIVYLEDAVQSLALPTRLLALARSQLLSLGSIGIYFWANTSRNLTNEWVVLFTSGSESLPKMVVLSEANLLANIEGSLDIFSPKESDILLGILPPFHSFGFTLNTLLPLVSGLRATYSPNPTDGSTIRGHLTTSSATILCGTPSFLRSILGSMEPGKHSLRILASGAEKCPQELMDMIQLRAPKARICEGYGITECSPVISMNPPDAPRPGTVGIPLWNVQVRIELIDGGWLKEWEGMILVSGPSVFSGYSDPTIADPFVEIEGVSWYKTGDLGYIDEDGYITITGRLKRFIKIAGEMISLPFIETILRSRFESADAEAPEIAVEALEWEGGSRICVFSIHPLELSDVHETLRSGGAPALIKIHSIIVLSTLPVLGTGKLDYKELKKLIPTF